MGDWKQKILRKRRKASNEHGKKGENCKASPEQRYYFCNPKARLDTQYGVWHRKAIEKNNAV